MNENHDHEDDLRRALHDAVSDVRPDGTLDQIRSRTDKVVPMNRRWLLPSLATAVVMAAVIGGAFWLVNDNDSTEGPATTPSQGTSSGSPSGTAGPDVATRAVPVYYLGGTAHGQKLYREFQSQQVCDTADCLMEAATVSALTGKPKDPDFTAPWPDGTGLNKVSYNGDVLTIDLSGDLHDRPSGMNQATARLAVEQLIYSAQAGLGQGRPPVQLLVDGQHSDQVLGEPASEPLAAGNPDSVLAPVQVDSPGQDQQVSRTFTVSGRAATFEANVVWELTQNGTVVKKGFTTATECCTLAPYSFQVTAPPGDYTLVVHDTDESGQGLPTNQDTKDITVQ